MLHNNFLGFCRVYIFEINIEITIEIPKPSVVKIMGHIMGLETPHIFDN